MPESVEALYAIADRQGWLLGETLEHALAALLKELAGDKGGARCTSPGMTGSPLDLRSLRCRCWQ